MMKLKSHYPLLVAALLVLTISVLSGCAEVAAFRSGVATHGSDAADQALETTLWALCNASPVGAINRRFKTQDEIEAYQRLCLNNLAAPIEQ